MKRMIELILIGGASIIVISQIMSGMVLASQSNAYSAEEQRNQAVIDQRRAWNRQESEREQAQDDLDSLGVPAVPENISELCESAGKQYNICPELLEAICWKESHFDPQAVNGDCKGLMQVNVSVHSEKLAVYGGDWTDPHTNIYTAAMVINDLIGRGYEELGSIMSMYHGEGTPDAYSQYTQDVGRISADLERIHGK